MNPDESDPDSSREASDERLPEISRECDDPLELLDPMVREAVDCVREFLTERALREKEDMP
jgi:hypothetical protein